MVFLFFTHVGPIWYIGLDSERRWHSQRILFLCDFEICRHFWRFDLKLFFGNSAFFRTLRLVLISAKPYYQNARIDRGFIFGVRRNLANDCQLPVISGLFVVSLISVFSAYFINLSGTLCGRPPPPPGPTAAAAVALTVRAAPPLPQGGVGEVVG